MKKKIIIILSLVILLIISIFIIYKNTKSRLYELNVDQVVEKIDNKENFILCISRTTCSHCLTYKPKLEKISRKYNIDIYYIDIDKYDDDEVNTFRSYVSFDGGTPTTTFIKDGTEVSSSNRINGDLDIDIVINKFKSNGFID